MEKNIANAKLKELTSLVSSNASADAIIAKGLEIKEYLWETWGEIATAVSVVDSLVNAFAPNREWQAGLTSRSALHPKVKSPSVKARTATIEKVLRIAAEIAATEDAVTSTKIAKKLREEGDQRSEKSIIISVGNILARRNNWKKVRAGEYKLIKENEEEKQPALIEK